MLYICNTKIKRAIGGRCPPLTKGKIEISSLLVSVVSSQSIIVNDVNPISRSAAEVFL